MGRGQEEGQVGRMYSRWGGDRRKARWEECIAGGKGTGGRSDGENV